MSIGESLVMLDDVVALSVRHSRRCFADELHKLYT